MDYSLTPGMAAKAWAKANPQAEAKILVMSFTPKGRGGWGVTEKGTEFYAASGKAAQTRGKFTSTQVERNGLCQVCGRVFIECVLRVCHAPDPDAWQELPLIMDEFDRSHGWKWLQAPFARVVACTGCIAQHPLDIGWYSGVRDEPPLTHLNVRHHPIYCQFEHAPIEITIDIREIQRGNATDPQIRVTLERKAK